MSTSNNNAIPFDLDLDKITEREVVPDFVERLSIGNNLIDLYDSKTIFPAGTRLLDGVIRNMIQTMDESDIKHLKSIKTTYTSVEEGSPYASILIPTGYTLYRIIQEKTGMDVTECFVDNGEYEYLANFDTPATCKDTYKAYCYKK